ncbi:TAXI family TRAP transporter solute-binding subunit [Burkholderia cepacia]|uniref:TAXI family TRAP transporter solute-binding subunit n=1 Tax=Burkholderia cepacia TaxID=292 RepID=UPI002AB63B1D|nr:TAXI family TRAP transporter solute-binding subunit [Burkholderia cepacia]
MNIGHVLAMKLCSYNSPLPKGARVSLTATDPGEAVMFGPEWVARGDFDIATSTPGWLLDCAAKGLDPYGEKLANLRAIAVFPHDDRLAFAVRRETGITSIRDIVERRIPLRVSIPSGPRLHPATWGIKAVLHAYGFSLEDIESWGGQLLLDRPVDVTDPTAPPVGGDFDAVFDEALMTPRWRNLTTLYDLVFLPIEDEILTALEGRGLKRGVIQRGRFASVLEDVPTVDYSGWFMYCRDDCPEEYIYLVTKAIVESGEQFEKRIPRESGLLHRVEPSMFLRELPIPLHDGAERCYKEFGYLK